MYSLTELVLLAVTSSLVFSAACDRAPTARNDHAVAVSTLQLSALTEDQRAAFACADEYRKEDGALAKALATDVSRWAAVPGEPPHWRSGGEWCVGFVDKAFAMAARSGHRDGGFAIVVRTNPCELLYKLAPGGCLPNRAPASNGPLPKSRLAR